MSSGFSGLWACNLFSLALDYVHKQHHFNGGMTMKQGDKAAQAVDRIEEWGALYVNVLNGDDGPLTRELEGMNDLLREFSSNAADEGDHRLGLICLMLVDLCTLILFMNLQPADEPTTPP